MGNGRDADKTAMIIGAKVDAGTLPMAANGRSLAIRGNGRACSACDEPIAPGEMELETLLDNGTELRFHLGCFAMWWKVTWSRRGIVAI